jgi:hypothetical protein
VRGWKSPSLYLSRRGERDERKLPQGEREDIVLSLPRRGERRVTLLSKKPPK